MGFAVTVEDKGRRGCVYTAGCKISDAVIFEQCQGPRGPEYAVYAIDGVEFLPEIFNIQGTIFEGKHFKPYPTCPWFLPGRPVETDPETLYSEISAYFQEHLELLDERQYDVMAAWVLATWRTEDFNTFPYLFFLGPKESGKTRALELLQSISYRAKCASNMTEATIFRAAEKYRLTLLLDESEHYGLKPEIVALLNSRYRRGQHVPRVEKTTMGYTLHWYDVFGPTALAGVNPLGDTLDSRTIVFNMEKRTRALKPFDLYKSSKAEELRCKLLYYRLFNCGKPLPERSLDDSVSDRLLELFKPLLSVASESAAQDLEEYAKDLARERLEAEESSTEAEVTQAILNCLNKTQTGKLSTRVVTDKLNEGIEDPQSLFKTRTVGRLLKRLGFKQVRMPDADGSRGIMLDRQRLKRLAARYRLQTPLDLLEAAASMPLINVRNVGNVGYNTVFPARSDISDNSDISRENQSGIAAKSCQKPTMINLENAQKSP